jgi:GNAT superfamily N-acetyltransferase
MEINVVKTDLKNILYLRELFLTEFSTQIRYNAVHERGWSDSYLIIVDGKKVGYGSVHGQEIKDRDTIFEFYLIPAYRNHSSLLFKQLFAISQVRFIECQSNDPLLSGLLFEFSEKVTSDVILLADHVSTDLSMPGAIFRPKKDDDQLFEHRHEPEGAYVIELNEEIVASGGFLLHYNKPFSDLYMEVREDMRKKGIGSYLIQEIKKECYLAGRVPAARTSINNHASKATLLKAGLKVSGFMLLGYIK